MVARKKEPEPEANTNINGAPIEQVANISYLGHMVTDDEKVLRK